MNGSGKWTLNVASQNFSYDRFGNRNITGASGRRARRITGGQETWHIYGIGGELLAEYAVGAALSAAQAARPMTPILTYALQSIGKKLKKPSTKNRVPSGIRLDC